MEWQLWRYECLCLLLSLQVAVTVRAALDLLHHHTSGHTHVEVLSLLVDVNASPPKGSWPMGKGCTNSPCFTAM